MKAMGDHWGSIQAFKTMSQINNVNLLLFIQQITCLEYITVDDWERYHLIVAADDDISVRICVEWDFYKL